MNDNSCSEDDCSWITNDIEELFTWGQDFLLPPPRPPYLDNDLIVIAEDLTTADVSTCNICNWAIQNTYDDSTSNANTVIDSGLSWTLTLILVSIISAVIGAIIMVTVLQCRKVPASSGSHRNFFCLGRRRRRRRKNNNQTTNNVTSTTIRLNNENKTINNHHNQLHQFNNNKNNINNQHETESNLSQTSSANNLCFMFHPCTKSNQSNRHQRQQRRYHHELTNMTSLNNKKSSNHYTVDDVTYHDHDDVDDDDDVDDVEEAVYTELDNQNHPLHRVSEHPLHRVSENHNHPLHRVVENHIHRVSENMNHPLHRVSENHNHPLHRVAENHNHRVSENMNHPLHRVSENPLHRVSENIITSPIIPAYQNTGYLQCDIDFISSTPSSAYYSDYSDVNRQYECIGDPNNMTSSSPQCDVTLSTTARQHYNNKLGPLGGPLGVINENNVVQNVPSEYI